MDVRLDGETRLYPIIGDPIAQVKSPALLTAMLVERGVNALVVPVHVVAADLDAWIDALKKTHNADGLVITVPHKIATLGHCDLPSERAVFAGSCNVMRRLSDGRWSGDNTDGKGYLDGIAKEGFDVSSFESFAKGTSHGAVYTAGDTSGSLLVKVINGDGAKQMPPGKKMSDEDIAKITSWVEQGANP